MNQLTPAKTPLTPKLTNTIKELSTNLAALKPNNSQTTQLITYTLLATALVGIMVYHYLKEQEKLT